MSTRWGKFKSFGLARGRGSTHLAAPSLPGGRCRQRCPQTASSVSRPAAQGVGAKHGGWRAGRQAGGGSTARKRKDHPILVGQQPAPAAVPLRLAAANRQRSLCPSCPPPPPLPEPPRWQGGHGGLPALRRRSQR